MNSIFTEENLLAFTTAARFGSFSKAAEELGLTTSAISYTIKRMETGLQASLDWTRKTDSYEPVFSFMIIEITREAVIHQSFMT